MPLNQIFSQQHSLIGPHSSNGGETAMRSHISPISKACKEESENLTQRKRLSSNARRKTGKKDRHSKICTAKGVRDRRMRLSLQVARRFFDLQDMLGFDKASKTIEWLLSKSKRAIKELKASSCSEEGNKSEVVQEEKVLAKGKNVIFEKRESREKARARARERTKEKMTKMNQAQVTYEYSNPMTPFLDQESNSTQENADGILMEEYLGVASSTTTSVFKYNDDDDHNIIINNNGSISSSNFMGFLGDWDLGVDCTFR
ncbi:unnamed protein product [Cuscuta europaea]|uniref:Uncharacterized protein n=1 Tax=Cuscuta europaea TaxID=41803 RepID=A0A9P0ZJB8_CUSEU|nr:unnamed protein product [Cuscuta europaea]